MSMMENAERRRKTRSERSSTSQSQQAGSSSTAVTRKKRTILTADDVNPLDKEDRHELEQAVLEMKTCKEIFTNWEFEVKACVMAFLD
jgi:hypothetical protein